MQRRSPSSSSIVCAAQRSAATCPVDEQRYAVLGSCIAITVPLVVPGMGTTPDNSACTGFLSHAYDDLERVRQIDCPAPFGCRPRRRLRPPHRRGEVRGPAARPRRRNQCALRNVSDFLTPASVTWIHPELAASALSAAGGDI